MIENKTVLVTGATGLLGSNIVHALMKSGSNKVLALSRNKSKTEKCFGRYFGDPNFVSLQQDISDGLSDDLGSIDYIFHAAGSIELSTIMNRPMEIINPNVEGTIKCLEFLRRQRVQRGVNGRMVIFSSESVYGRPEKGNSEVSENDTAYADALNVRRTPYSHSKRMSEVIASAYVRQYDTDAVIARFAWIYGNCEYRPKQALFDFILSALDGEDIVIKNPSCAQRDNLYIQDALDAVFLIAEKGEKGEAYNISSNGDLGNLKAPDELARIITKIVNDGTYLEERAIPAKDQCQVIYDKQGQPNSINSMREGGVIMNNSKLKKLGWQVNYSIEDGMKNLIKSVSKSLN